ncbi:MAG: hypothetical protein J4F43_02015 [Dehalococcoidia bacterium]|nr:hypothetical protein [Dehalococcoidia bacterium]
MATPDGILSELIRQTRNGEISWKDVTIAVVAGVDNYTFTIPKNPVKDAAHHSVNVSIVSDNAGAKREISISPSPAVDELYGLVLERLEQASQESEETMLQDVLDGLRQRKQSTK